MFPRLWRCALVLTSNRDAAFDLAQATCLRALENHEKFEAGTALDRWLFRMAHRIWLNELRATAVRRGGGLQPIEDIDIPDTNMSAETNIFFGEVLQTVNELPEAQRTCVLLAYVEGFKYAEVAEILDIPVGTVMSRLAAARKTVSSRMKDEDVRTG
nr:RNA polymerase sigma factor [uncultured Hoeflea sp.]